MSEEQEIKVYGAKIKGEMAEKIDAFCKKTDKRVSDVVREALVDYLKKTGELTDDAWAKAEGDKKRSECLYFIEGGRCDKHTYEKGQFPEALQKKAEELGLEVNKWTREWTEGLFPFVASKKVDYEYLVPNALFCRECRLWRPKPY